MASAAPITSLNPETPCYDVGTVQLWLGQAEAILTLAVNDIDGTSPGVVSLGALGLLLTQSMEKLERVEIALMREGRAN